MRFKTIQPDNPILRAEISYQKRTIPRWLQWFDRFGVIILALVISLVLFLTPINGDLYGSGLWLYPYVFSALPPLLWVAQFAVIFRCIFAGVNTIHRGWQERDLIALTGITRRQILIGKFWSVLYQLRGWTLALGIINLAVAALVSTNLAIYCYRMPLEYMRVEIPYGYLGSYTSYYDYAMHLRASYCPNPRTADQMILIVIHTTAVSILGVMVSTAIGLVGGLFSNKAVNFTLALIFRLAPVVIFTLFPDYPYAGGYIIWRWYEYTWFSFADGGSTGILRAGTIYYGAYGPNMTIQPVLWAFWAAIIMYIAYLVFAYLISQFLLRRQGILSAASK